MMERYFGQASEAKLPEQRPDLHYQVGVTPDGTEVPRVAMDPAIKKEIAEQPEEHRATMPRGADLKWRYMWRVGERPKETKFAELNSEPVVPQGFPEWSQVMDGWGRKMMDAVQVVAEMVAQGLGLSQGSFTDLMDKGPHLLAPTGSDLEKHAQLGNVFAGYHYDLNFLTIHGKSRFPGLFIWLRNGQRVPVRIPDGCLLLQAGKQLEWLTGGDIRAGMHEVVVSPSTLEAVERARGEGRSLWRVSSTMFSHVASDRTLTPLGQYARGGASASYPPVLAGDYVSEELKVINLAAKGG
mmetsp:Transcript_65761/g.208142  ORF Transcript_65761/g.208142 Transcript_65761/m.208142 type:complete len:297 (+) Transcript_65761:421-1311(+)